MEVHKEPNSNPKTGPKIFIPMFMAVVEMEIWNHNQDR